MIPRQIFLTWKGRNRPVIRPLFGQIFSADFMMGEPTCR